jgi:hypothetical protein
LHEYANPRDGQHSGDDGSESHEECVKGAVTEFGGKEDGGNEEPPECLTHHCTSCATLPGNGPSGVTG